MLIPALLYSPSTRPLRAGEGASTRTTIGGQPPEAGRGHEQRNKRARSHHCLTRAAWNTHVPSRGTAPGPLIAPGPNIPKLGRHRGCACTEGLLDKLGYTRRFPSQSGVTVLSANQRTGSGGGDRASRLRTRLNPETKYHASMTAYLRSACVQRSDPQGQETTPSCTIMASFCPRNQTRVRTPTGGVHIAPNG